MARLFLSGSLSPISKVLVIPNTDKKEEKDPDYYMYLEANEQKGSPNKIRRVAERQKER